VYNAGVVRPALSLVALTGLLVVAVFTVNAPSKAYAAGAAMVEVGSLHSCAVTNSGAAKCWGSNSQGQLGWTPYACFEPGECSTQAGDVTGLGSGVESIAAGQFHTCAVTVTGAALCWGANDRGQLGDGTTTNRPTPVLVAGLTSGVAAIDAGNDHTCAVLDNGTMRCWGSDEYGQLGANVSELCGVEHLCSTTPITTAGLNGLTMVRVATGDNHTCGVTSAGGIKCWGHNTRGQLGNGNTADAQLPGDVSGLTSGAADIAAGFDHTCAVIASTQGLRCWGSASFGKLGVPGPDNCDGFSCAKTPVNVTSIGTTVSDVAAGFAHTCVATTGLDVKCFGENLHGQLGNGTNDNSQTPVDACRLVPSIPEALCLTSLLPDFSQVAAGGRRSCAVASSGSLECWGEPLVGDWTTGSRRAPVIVRGFGSGADADGDGCTNTAEQQATPGSEASGGRRDAKSFWDFFDTPAAPNTRDKIVSAADVTRVVQRFGSSGDAAGNPLLAPPASGYHTAFDRSSPQPGRDPWDLGPPNGSITAADIASMVAQFGHSCA
jgi:alpha-tubulin suppressor-like RCC1 family protein